MALRGKDERARAAPHPHHRCHETSNLWRVTGKSRLPLRRLQKCRRGGTLCGRFSKLFMGPRPSVLTGDKANANAEDFDFVFAVPGY